jgi:agmatine/peptidylarginine deiminase
MHDFKNISQERAEQILKQELDLKDIIWLPAQKF